MVISFTVNAIMKWNWATNNQNRTKSEPGLKLFPVSTTARSYHKKRCKYALCIL